MDPKLESLLQARCNDYRVSPNDMYIYTTGIARLLLWLAEDIIPLGYRLKGGIQDYRGRSEAATFIKIGEPKTNEAPGCASNGKCGCNGH